MPVTEPAGPPGPPSRGATPEVACTHCGLPVPRALLVPGETRQFCCHGCRTVFEVIHRHGLERFYTLAREDDPEPQPARTTDRSYEEFDDPAFDELYVRERPDGMRAVELYLEGVHCAACVWLVEKVPLRVPGVAEVRLDLRRSMAHVAWDPRTTRLSAVAAFLDSLGYPAHPYRGVEQREMRRREDRALLVRIAVAGACAGNAMMLAGALYGGAWHGMDLSYEALFRWTSLLVAVPAMWAAGVFFRGAWGSLRARALHMDVPISIGILAGFVSGTWATLRGTGDVYFDSVTALIFLLLVGRFVQQRRQRAATDSTELLHSLAPSSARSLEPGGAVRVVPIEALRPGQSVEVPSGDSVPVDGVVAAGQSEIDASLLTGESRPVGVAEGDPVFAGTLNLSSRLEVRVTAAGERTRVGRLSRLVEESARRRAPVVRLADRVSAVFVGVVLTLALATLVGWWHVDPHAAVDHAIALLIVTCPCALGLATPLAVSVAIGRAGRGGILIKGGDALEQLAGTGRIFLDKTGTLTEGKMKLVCWWGERSVAGLVRAAELTVSHPVARALVDGLAGDDAPDGSPAVERSADGAGLTAELCGRRISIGSARFVERTSGPIADDAARETDRLANEGLTPVLVADGARVVAVAGVGDPLRERARAVVDELRGSGWRVEILSGDDPRVVRTVARRLGVDPRDARGAATPEEKLRIVERAAGEGRVVMVGDGVNDAAALSAATVGIAVQGGAEAAMATADVFLADSRIDSLARLFRGAGRTMTVIRRNLAFSLLYNVVGATLAIGGWIGPLTAAVLMPLSSLTVITYSFRAKTF